MNITNFFQPIMASTSNVAVTSKSGQSSGGNFGDFLNIDQSSNATTNDLIDLLAELFNGMNMEEITDLLESNPEITEQLSALMNFMQLSKDDEVSSQLVVKINDLFTTLLEDESVDGSVIPVNHVEFTIKEDQTEALLNQMIQLLTEVANLVSAFKEDGNLSKADSSNLIALLKQWSMLKQRASDSGIDVSKLVDNTLDEDSDLWNELVQRFEKRAFYAGQNMYNQESGVSKQDVMNWLQQATAEESSQPKVTIAQHGLTPVSKVEQYVIHVHSMNKVEGVSAEMMDKLTTIVKESNFLTRNTGQMELSLILRPEHLGNITVRFAQVDGEMMVKLLVSSQMAKDMLESNLHQLRHLFSPHQVAIERNEAIPDDKFFMNEEEQQEQHEEQLTEENNKDQQHEKHQENSDVDFETIFNKLSEEGII